jgi:predicted HTH domain antitoxin
LKTITIAFPNDTTLPFGSSDDQFARELRLAGAIFRYGRGLISQGKGAEIAGLTRADFIDALGRAIVSAIQTTAEELKEELVRPLHARRSCIGADSASLRSGFG